jgi:hypothetical protein
VSRVARWFVIKPKNPNLGKFFGGLAIENLGIFYDHFTAIGNILWPFAIFCGHLVYFSPFVWYSVPRKIWQPCQ